MPDYLKDRGDEEGDAGEADGVADAADEMDAVNESKVRTVRQQLERTHRPMEAE